MTAFLSRVINGSALAFSKIDPRFPEVCLQTPNNRPERVYKVTFPNCTPVIAVGPKAVRNVTGHNTFMFLVTGPVTYPISNVCIDNASLKEIKDMPESAFVFSEQPTAFAGNAANAFDSSLTTASAIKRLRVKHNWTQTEFGEKIGMTQHKISRMERGTGIRAKDILKIVSVLESLPPPENATRTGRGISLTPEEYEQRALDILSNEPDQIPFLSLRWRMSGNYTSCSLAINRLIEAGKITTTLNKRTRMVSLPRPVEQKAVVADVSDRPEEVTCPLPVPEETMKNSTTDHDKAVRVLAPFPDDLISTKEACKISGKTEKTIRNWRSKGLRSFGSSKNSNSKVCFSRSELLSFIEKMGASRSSISAAVLLKPAVGKKPAVADRPETDIDQPVVAGQPVKEKLSDVLKSLTDELHAVIVAQKQAVIDRMTLEKKISALTTTMQLF